LWANQSPADCGFIAVWTSAHGPCASITDRGFIAVLFL